MCGICGLLAPDVADPALVQAMNDAIVHRGPDHGAVAPYGRCTLALPPPLDHRPPDRRPAARERERLGRRGLQRRALQLPRAPARARGEGARDPGDGRLAADPARLRGVGRRVRLPARGDVRDRALGPRGRAARARARPAREEAAALCRAARRVACLRLRDEGAPSAPEAPSRARPAAARRLPRAPVRAALRAEGGREGAAGLVRRRRGRVGAGRAILAAAAGGRARDGRGMGRAGPRRGDRGGSPAARLGRAPRRAALGRARLLDRGVGHGGRVPRAGARHSRSAFRTAATTSGRTRERSPSGSGRPTRSSRSTRGPSCSTGSPRRSTSRSATRRRCRPC